mmetsp:Transcript_4539/g.5736  ORF Transcript_4539/g.5736 Transcript_4539/m.5736 type:complete len:120 (+) Transcript_4539:2-361(+)
MVKEVRSARRRGAKEEAQIQARRAEEKEKEPKGIKWGPVLVFSSIFLFFVIGAGITAYDMYTGNTNNKGETGYYWCIDQVETFYRKRNPEKLGGVADLCKKYAGKEKRLLEKLYMKYNN